MVRRCCVTGCKSNYDSELKKGKKIKKSSLPFSDSSVSNESNDEKLVNTNYVSTFLFPKNEDLRQQWMKNIPRKEWKVSATHAVCILHFEEKDIDLYDEFTAPDGTVRKERKFRPLLRQNAVPRIFPNLSEHLNKPSAKERTDPTCRKQEFVERENKKQEDWLDADKIKDNNAFRQEVPKFVQNLKKNWVVAMNSTLVIIYFLENLMDIQQIGCSLTIDNQLNIKVCIRGNLVTSKDLSWIIPSNQPLNRWSQLENILNRYREPTMINKNSSTNIILDRINFLEESVQSDD